MRDFGGSATADIGVIAKTVAVKSSLFITDSPRRPSRGASFNSWIPER